MKLMNCSVLAFSLTTAAVLPIAAHSNQGQSVNSDVYSVFEVDSDSQIHQLTKQEMIETDGAWIPYAIGGTIGFVSGNYAYMTNAAFDQRVVFSWRDYTQTVATSTMVGAVQPVRGVQTAATAMGTSWLSAWNLRW